VRYDGKNADVVGAGLAPALTERMKCAKHVAHTVKKSLCPFVS